MAELAGAEVGEVAGAVDADGGGNAVPDFCWTSVMSALLIAPFTVTSSRKLLCVISVPDCD